MNGREELLRQKLTILQELLGETEKQRGLIAAGDVEGLSGSIAARQTLMDAIDALDGRIAALPPAKAGAANGEIHTLLERILRIDGENRQNAASMTTNLTAGFREVSAQRNMMAYMPSGDRSSKFVDKEG